METKDTLKKAISKFVNNEPTLSNAVKFCEEIEQGMKAINVEEINFKSEWNGYGFKMDNGSILQFRKCLADEAENGHIITINVMGETLRFNIPNEDNFDFVTDALVAAIYVYEDKLPGIYEVLVGKCNAVVIS